MSYDCNESDGIRFIAHQSCAKDVLRRINIVEAAICDLDSSVYSIIEDTEFICGSGFFDFGSVVSSSSSSSSSNCMLRRLPCDQNESILLLSDSDLDVELLELLNYLENDLCALRIKHKELLAIYDQGCDQYSSSSSSSQSSSSSSHSSSSSSSRSSSSSSSSFSYSSSSSSSSSGVSSSSSSSSSSSGVDCCIGDVVLYCACPAWGPNYEGDDGTVIVPTVLHSITLGEAGYGPCAYSNESPSSSSSSSSSSESYYGGIIVVKYELSSGKWQIWEDGVLAAEWAISFGDRHCDPRAAGVYQFVGSSLYADSCGSSYLYQPVIE